MRGLIVSDKPDWSYWQIAKAIQKHNPDPDLTIDVMSLKGRVVEFWDRERDYDRVLIMGLQMIDGITEETPFWKLLYLPRYKIDGSRWLTGIHSHHAWDDGKTTPEGDVSPGDDWLRTLRRFRNVNAVSLRLRNLFSRNGVSVHYTPNGVDTEVFKPTTPLTTDGPLRVGVAYTPKHDWRKGVEEFIRPACERVGAVLVEAKARSEQHVRPEDMPAWYRGLDVYCCMSSSEGFSIAVLEAAASGVPVISTRVGGSTELIVDGTGLLIDRSVEALVEALNWFNGNRPRIARMGERIRQHVVAHWSWEKRAPAWHRFLTG